MLPTRLLYIGDPQGPKYDPDFLHIEPTNDMSKAEYIALSHCWGNIREDQKRQFCTTTENIRRRETKFSIINLPKTFQDAIKVTRELGVHYLWIDSLCIIQYGDNRKDWNQECQRMEGVFASAYCTIAATSATDSYTGFLERNISSKYIHVENRAGHKYYVSGPMDDFKADVENAKINTRAWVLQESVLSHRIIHFTGNQTYWECGDGVYCENLTCMKSLYRKQHFALDPRFPERILSEPDEKVIIEFIHFLIEGYTKRSLSERSDRAFALLGLQAAIKSALKCQASHGIFQKYIHRNLLWMRSAGKRLKRIDYRPSNLPSWSWMANHGEIQFLKIPFGNMEWIDHLSFDEKGHALITYIGEFQNCSLKQEGNDYAIMDLCGVKRGRIWYDIEGGDDIRHERCCIIGKNSDKEHYMLVLRPKAAGDEYERVGVGSVQSDYISRRKFRARVI